MNILVISAHPDDEVLGMGATIKKLSRKRNKIHLGVVSEGATSQYQDKKMIKVRRDACLKAGKILGIDSFEFLEFPDMRLDSIPQIEITVQIEKIIAKSRPEIVYTTPPHDFNKDHQKVFESTIVATRPQSSNVKQVLCYELPGSFNSSFCPTLYEDVSKDFSYKTKALKMYKSEMEKFPHPRSLEAIESLAITRGVESGLKKAESFRLIRGISI